MDRNAQPLGIAAYEEHCRGIARHVHGHREVVNMLGYFGMQRIPTGQELGVIGARNIEPERLSGDSL